MRINRIYLEDNFTESMFRKMRIVVSALWPMSFPGIGVKKLLSIT